MRVLLAMIALSSAALGQSTILGVLEDVPAGYPGEQGFRAVRLAFQKTGSEWHALYSTCVDQGCLKTMIAKYPPEVTWTIAFDGRRLGQIITQAPKSIDFHSEAALEPVTGRGPVPTIGKKSAEYGGFTDAEVYRPLVANSQPYFKDPESWKRSQLSARDVALLRQAFGRKFGKMCKTSKDDETKLEPLAYRDEDIKVVKAYASARSWQIARLHLAGAIECDDTDAGFEIDDTWFTVSPQKSVQFLGQGMWLVDAGDYDNDGKSELVFAIDRYNRGGYELFYDDFRKSAKFEFSYH